jgi:hypothetical protein
MNATTKHDETTVRAAKWARAQFKTEPTGSPCFLTEADVFAIASAAYEAGLRAGAVRDADDYDAVDEP